MCTPRTPSSKVAYPVAVAAGMMQNHPSLEDREGKIIRMYELNLEKGKTAEEEKKKKN